MKSAIQSFLLVTLVILICGAGAWIYLKSKTANQVPPKAVPTTFFDNLKPFTLIESATSLSLKEIQELQNSQILWLDVQVTKDNAVVVLSEREVGNPNFNETSTDRRPETKLKRMSVRYLTLADLEKIVPQVNTLEVFLRELPSQRWILNVVDYPPNADKVFSELIEANHASDKIIFHSEQDGPLTDLRKLEPMWLFGTSRAQIVQTLWLTNLGLQAMAPLRGDVLITPIHAEAASKNKKLVNDELIAEARRRSMKVLLGPVSKSEIEEAHQLNADGAIITR